MDTRASLRNRAVSFIGPFIMDGTALLLLTAIPLLAIRNHASTIFVGMLGWLPQLCRFPVCSFSGRLSDKVGRLWVIAPSLLIAAAACIACTQTDNPILLLVILCAFIVANGGFYPPFQASIGDRSPNEELRKNLASFNGGLTIGGSGCAVVCAYLLTMGRDIPFILGAVLMASLLVLVVLWMRHPIESPAHEDSGAAEEEEGPGILLPIARMGLFVIYTGYAMGRFVFPNLAAHLGMSEHTIGVVAGMILVGQGCGVLFANVGPWWRGKTWPLLAIQCTAIVSGLMILVAQSAPAFGAAFFLLGICVGINYTAAIYYAMQRKSGRGKNTSIHESIISGGLITGSLVGAPLAQYISSRTPYAVFSIFMFAAMIASVSMVAKENRIRVATLEEA